MGTVDGIGNLGSPAAVEYWIMEISTQESACQVSSVLSVLC